MNTNEVKKMIGMEIKGGFKFDAILEDGSRITIRQKATRRYAIAAFHSNDVVSKFSYRSPDRLKEGDEVRAKITFHNATPTAQGPTDRIVAIMAIDWDGDCPVVTKGEPKRTTTPAVQEEQTKPDAYRFGIMQDVEHGAKVLLRDAPFWGSIDDKNVWISTKALADSKATALNELSGPEDNGFGVVVIEMNGDTTTIAPPYNRGRTQDAATMLIQEAEQAAKVLIGTDEGVAALVAMVEAFEAEDVAQYTKGSGTPEAAKAWANLVEKMNGLPASTVDRAVVILGRNGRGIGAKILKAAVVGAKLWGTPPIPCVEWGKAKSVGPFGTWDAAIAEVIVQDRNDFPAIKAIPIAEFDGRGVYCGDVVGIRTIDNQFLGMSGHDPREARGSSPWYSFAKGLFSESFEGSTSSIVVGTSGSFGWKTVKTAPAPQGDRPASADDLEEAAKDAEAKGRLQDAADLYDAAADASGTWVREQENKEAAARIRTSIAGRAGAKEVPPKVTKAEMVDATDYMIKGAATMSLVRSKDLKGYDPNAWNVARVYSSSPDQVNIQIRVRTPYQKGAFIATISLKDAELAELADAIKAVQAYRAAKGLGPNGLESGRKVAVLLRDLSTSGIAREKGLGPIIPRGTIVQVKEMRDEAGGNTIWTAEGRFVGRYFQGNGYAFRILA
jgi:hypothetical protein